MRRPMKRLQICLPLLLIAAQTKSVPMPLLKLRSPFKDSTIVLDGQQSLSYWFAMSWGDDHVRPRASSNSAMISFHDFMNCLLLPSSLWPHVANNYDYNTILLGGYEDSFDSHRPGLNIYAPVSDLIDHTLQVLLSLGNHYQPQRNSKHPSVQRIRSICAKTSSTYTSVGRAVHEPAHGMLYRTKKCMAAVTVESFRSVTTFSTRIGMHRTEESVEESRMV